MYWILHLNWFDYLLGTNGFLSICNRAMILRPDKNPVASINKNRIIRILNFVEMCLVKLFGH